MESPTSVQADATRLSVSGWVFCRERSIRELLLQIDGGAPITIPYGLPRADVAAAYQDAASLKSGFGIEAPIAIGNRRQITLHFIARFDEEQATVCLSKTFRVGRSGRAALRRADSLVLGALEKLRIALQNRNLPLSPIKWAAVTAQHWREVFDQPRIRQPRGFDAQSVDIEYRRSSLSTSANLASRARAKTTERLDFIALLDETANIDAVIEAIASLCDQAFRPWLVCVADSVRRTSAARQSISDASPDVLSVASLLRPDGTWLPPGGADYVVLFDQHAVPASGIIEALEPALRGGAFDWIYTDDDRQRPGEDPSDPYLKCGVSRELALVDDYMTRLAVVRRRAIEEAGGLRVDAGDAQIYDLLLRVLQRSSKVHHLPVIGCHRRDGVPAALGIRHRETAERVVLAPHGASFGESQLSSPRGHLLHSVAWPARVLDRLPVTIVIPTRDRVDLLARGIDSIGRTVPAGVEVLVIDDHSREPATGDYLCGLENDASRRFRVVRVTRTDDRFNYARLMNTASREVTTPLMLHLNNDIEALVPGWLQQMAGWLTIPEVGIVGAKLLDRQGAIDHAGVVVAPYQGIPEHMFSGLEAHDAGYHWLPHRLRNVSAVTGACLLTRTDDFARLGGFEEDHLGVQFNDVDYCLRIIASGRRIVYEPAAVLVHDVSASRGSRHDYRENAFFLTKYASYRDPFISPHLDPRSLATPTPRLLRSLQGAAENS